MKAISIKEAQQLQLDAALDFHALCMKYNINYYLIAGCAIGSVRHGGFIPWDEDMDFAMMRPEYERFLEICKAELENSKYFIQNYHTDKNCVVALSRFCIKNTFIETESMAHIAACKNIYFDIFPLDNVPNQIELREKQKKDLARINKFIQFKIGYRLKSRAVWKQTIHNIIAKVLGIIPFRLVIARKEKIMKRYENYNTSCVCSMASKYSYDKQTMPREYYGEPTYVKFENTQFPAPEQLELYLSHLYGDYMKLPPIEKRKPHHEGYFIL